MVCGMVSHLCPVNDMMDRDDDDIAHSIEGSTAGGEKFTAN
jgi:hypothetical protein